MASFSFGFQIDDEYRDNDQGKVSSPQVSQDAFDEKQNTPNIGFSWVPNVPELLVDRTKEVLVYTEVMLSGEDKEEDNTIPLRYVDLAQSSYRRRPNDDNNDGDEIWHHTDLQPGVYEGGRKVWECSWDLVHYLHRTSALHQRDLQHVWELGCGQGLPGCYIRRQCPAAHVYFTDYNEDVVLDCTLSNIVLNTQLGVETDASSQNTSIFKRTHVGFGNWLDMPVVDAGGFDLILAAETLYTTHAALDTCELLVRHLLPESGVALVATKRYYFGVGGGVDVFRCACEGKLLTVETVQVLDGGVGNIREILRVTKTN